MNSDPLKKIEITLVENQLEYAKDFAALNYEWLNKYFTIEPHDKEMLDDPETYIIKKGGHILFALYKNNVVGAAALIMENTNTFELAKMAVAPKFQGLKIGEKLINKAIEKSKKLGINNLVLESSRKLKPAINLYKKTGFREVPLTGRSPYSRCDIRMQLDLGLTQPKQ